MAIAGTRSVSVLDCIGIPPAEQEAAICRVAAVCETFQVRGWRAAERNLDFPVVWAAWLLHRQGGYLRRGGIEGAVARALSLSVWRIVARTNSFGGAIVTLRIKNFRFHQKMLDSEAVLT